MSQKRRLFIGVILALILLPVLAFVFLRNPTNLTFDLRDGSRLELVGVSFGTNHIAHFGNLPQKALFKIVGTRVPEKWGGFQMITPAQSSVNGSLGVFVQHHLPLGDFNITMNTHNYKIKPVAQPHPNHSMFLSSGQGEYGLWELVYWTTNHSTFLIENSRGESVGRFRISRGPHAEYSIETEAEEHESPAPVRFELNRTQSQTEQF